LGYEREVEAMKADMQHQRLKDRYIVRQESGKATR
jgi:hypothetical protein